MSRIEYIVESFLHLSPLNPIVTAYDFGASISGGVVGFSTKHLNPSSLVDSIGSAILSPITTIWTWILYNLLSPIFVIVFTILFFLGQYYLIRTYIKLFQWFGASLIRFVAYITNSPKIKNFIDSLVENLA